METINNMTREELKQIIYESFEDVLNNKKDFISNAVLEAMEDIGLAKAMEEGKTGEYMDEEVLKKRINENS